SSIFAGTGTINTSDANEKQQIQDISDTILDAWSEVNYCMFKFNDAVALKGDEARFHFGVIAQKIDEAFTNHGLNAFDYGLLCKDVLEDGRERWGVRMTECLVLESALMRRELNRLRGN
ncbi:MAG TPA: tail fiber domain-containing protein, partial [Rummeliibacillus sp.]|nr:tail fiber domain-containing protein [Rummeliibacillus sp.]